VKRRKGREEDLDRRLDTSSVRKVLSLEDGEHAIAFLATHPSVTEVGTPALRDRDVLQL
jgi:hypothetical protein